MKGDVIQVPLVFIFMSRRQREDYVAVLEYVKTQLLTICVVEIVSDFERAIFSAVRTCFLNVSHFGCSFHWKQAVLRKTKQLGFSAAYVKPGKIRETVQKLLCLPYLPTEKIEDVFLFVKSEAPLKLSPLFNYIHRVWVSPTALWSPQNWSVYFKATRTNNDCEGIHSRWNQIARGALILLDFTLFSRRS